MSNHYFVQRWTFVNVVNVNLNNMKWLLENNFGHDSYTFVYAVLNGNLDNMKWLLENNFDHDYLIFVHAVLIEI